MFIQRNVSEQIKKDLDEKIVLLSGARQCGKTALSKMLGFKDFEYLNFDSSKDRLRILKQDWNRKCDLVIFDELHKMPKWKSWIKGIFDTEGVRPRLLVTGSARLDTFRKGGDSLAGRHTLIRLGPFSLAEVCSDFAKEEAWERFLDVGAFPEPFLKASSLSAARWRNNYLDRILRGDVLDIEQIRNLKGLEILVDLLADRVGSPVSFRSLALDLQVSPATVQRWVLLLERLFVVFIVSPYSKSIARALLKEPKIYFFDTGRIKNDPGMRTENAVALELYLRTIHLEDLRGEKSNVHYTRDKEKREVDFLTVRNKKPEFLIEVKSKDISPSNNLTYFAERIEGVKAVQLVGHLEKSLRHKLFNIEPASEWLLRLGSTY